MKQKTIKDICSKSFNYYHLIKKILYKKRVCFTKFVIGLQNQFIKLDGYIAWNYLKSTCKNRKCKPCACISLAIHFLQPTSGSVGSHIRCPMIQIFKGKKLDFAKFADIRTLGFENKSTKVLLTKIWLRICGPYFHLFPKKIYYGYWMSVLSYFFAICC